MIKFIAYGNFIAALLVGIALVSGDPINYPELTRFTLVMLHFSAGFMILALEGR